MVIRVKNKKRIFAYLTIIYLLVMSGSVLHLLGRTVIWRFPMCMEIPGLAATVCSLT